MLNLSTGSCSQYSGLLWKTANPVCWNRTNFHLLPDAASHEYTLSVFYSLSMRWQTLLVLGLPQRDITCQCC